MRCEQPDKDVPEIVCGHPLPCPWHTVKIDTTCSPPVIHIPVTNPRALRPKILGPLKEIAACIEEL
jgi:hypothetical protein